MRKEFHINFHFSFVYNVQFRFVYNNVELENYIHDKMIDK